MKQALFYKKQGKNLKCELCPHNCIIPEGKTGFCNVRKNIKNKLYSLVYGKPVPINIDPIEKKPLFHFEQGKQILSIGTFGCNMTCFFCQNYEISQTKEIKNFDKILDKIEYKSPEDIIKLTDKLIAFTYNEPTVYYEYMLDIAKLAKKNSIKTEIGRASCRERV